MNDVEEIRRFSTFFLEQKNAPVTFAEKPQNENKQIDRTLLMESHWKLCEESI